MSQPAIASIRGNSMYLPRPRFFPPLDPDFLPAVLAYRAYLEAVSESGQAEKVILGLERIDGSLSRFESLAFRTDHSETDQSVNHLERILKFLLWQQGARKVYVGGPKYLGNQLGQVYSTNGNRRFDVEFMGRVYGKPFTLVGCSADEVPPQRSIEKHLGRHLNGNRIGFDLGASDIKVSAVVEGEPVFSTEIEWQPVEQTDPAYHRAHILSALRLAASKLKRVDAIGGSSAGVYIDNRPIVASLYRGVPAEKFRQIQNLFLDIQREFGVQLEVVNDGEVTALAGSMSLEDNQVLGIAMGSSQAAGYVTAESSLTDWINELAFAPVDYSPTAPIDEWSGDRGVGSQYFSQQCVFRLAPRSGIEIPAELTNAQKLEFVQNLLESGHKGAMQIWETMGIYLGYSVAHYATFYDIRHLLILGRCTSGSGGPMLLTQAGEILKNEFPELAKKIQIQLPDEKSRRVGQSIAAASLPLLPEVTK